MATTFADWSSMISAPHIAAVALPVMALISHSRSSSASSTPSITPSVSPPAVPHVALWPEDSLQEFVVDSNSTPSASSSTNDSASKGLAGLVTSTIHSWRSRIAAQAELLSEVQELQAEDDGDEADWYAHERSTSVRSRSASRARSSSNRSCTTRTRSRSSSKATLSAEDLTRRLVSLEARTSRDSFLLAPPPQRRRRAAC